jgi:hypothetical protein
MAVSFIGGGTSSTWRNPPTCLKSLTAFNQIMLRVFNANFNNISVVLWHSVLLPILVEETGVCGENH